MSDGLLAVALGAGLLAAVNPCGFALLPAYVSLLVVGEGAGSRAAAIGRALLLTLAVTLGFTLVFAVFGLVVAPVAAGVQRYLPWFTVVLGVLLLAVGALLAAGRPVRLPHLSLPRRLRRRRRPAPPRRPTASFWSMTGFGAGYAVASLSCTVAPFLAVVVGGFRAGTALEGVLLFLAYAAGMGLVVGTLAVATARASPTAVRAGVGRVRRAGGALGRTAGLLLALAGAYVTWYGVWELRVLAGADPADPVVDSAAALQREVVGLVAAVGPGGWAIALLVLLGLAGGRALLTSRRGRGQATLAAGPGAGSDRDPGPSEASP